MTRSTKSPIAARIANAIPNGAHRNTVGLRAMPLADWIEDGEDFTPQLRERAHLLASRDDVVKSLPSSQAAQRELLALLSAHLREHLAEHYTFRCAGGIDQVTVHATAHTLSFNEEHNGQSCTALRLAAHLVAEDLCLLQADASGQYRLTAAALCFPTRWRLSAKLGQALLDIHSPVPGYADEVGAATDRVMSSLDSTRPLWRHNWSLLDSPVLYQPERIVLKRALRAHELGQRLWMRSERQTLRRLPHSGAVLFTIRIRQCTLDELCQQAGVAARLLTQLRTMPAALKVYKGLQQMDELLYDYLCDVPNRPFS
ncbi:MAG: hypothetical protein ACI8W7_002727 [Gammaproteobacteria bacterium]|jgi:hypothetical protein